MKPEQLIFSQLLLNEEYVRRVIPYLKEEYFLLLKIRIYSKSILDIPEVQ